MSGRPPVQGGAAVRVDDLPPELAHMVRRQKCCLLIVYRCTFAASSAAETGHSS